MRVVLQRVSKSRVEVASKISGEIGNGLMLLVGFENADEKEDRDWMIRKITNLRIFNDDYGMMNLSIKDIQGDILVISQFTLHANTKKGNRPSFIKSAKAEVAESMYDLFKQELELELGQKIQSGIFGANMQVRLINDGPVTIIIDSKNRE